jgi:hypothetical protein
MDHATHWSVDRLAAGNLLAQLKLDASDDLIDLVTRHFSEHRRNMVEWAAERVHDNVVRALEDASTGSFSYRSEDWVRGFQHAEALVLGMPPRELLQLEADNVRSKGQILRTMVRQSRQKRG